MKYYPALSTSVSELVSSTALDESFRDVGTTRKPQYNLELSEANVNTFQTFIEPLPNKIMAHISDSKHVSTERAEYGERYYAPENIHDARIAVVSKAALQEAFDQRGLDKATLLHRATRAIQTRTSIPVDTLLAKHISYSGKEGSATRNWETPVNLVVPAKTYDEVADRLYRYEDGTLRPVDVLFPE